MTYLEGHILRMRNSMFYSSYLGNDKIRSQLGEYRMMQLPTK